LKKRDIHAHLGKSGVNIKLIGDTYWGEAMKKIFFLFIFVLAISQSASCKKIKILSPSISSKILEKLQLVREFKGVYDLDLSPSEILLELHRLEPLFENVQETKKISYKRLVYALTILAARYAELSKKQENEATEKRAEKIEKIVVVFQKILLALQETEEAANKNVTTIDAVGATVQGQLSSNLIAALQESNDLVEELREKRRWRKIKTVTLIVVGTVAVACVAGLCYFIGKSIFDYFDKSNKTEKEIYACEKAAKEMNSDLYQMEIELRKASENSRTILETRKELLGRIKKTRHCLMKNMKQVISKAKIMRLMKRTHQDIDILERLIRLQDKATRRMIKTEGLKQRKYFAENMNLSLERHALLSQMSKARKEEFRRLRADQDLLKQCIKTLAAEVQQLKGQ